MKWLPAKQAEAAAALESALAERRYTDCTSLNAQIEQLQQLEQLAEDASSLASAVASSTFLACAAFL